tara:strand:- start:1936 stop:2838 length:903 start_codon:yes stop_codon:yes gene_type:complete
MPRTFTDEDIYTLAGVTLANETVESYRRQGYGESQIKQMMGDAFEGGPSYFQSLGRSVLGDEIPDQWTNLSREDASRIEAGESPFEGWRETFVDRRPAPEGAEPRTEDPFSPLSAVYNAQMNPALGAARLAYNELYAKPKRKRQAHQERLRQDALSRIRAGDPYAGGYAAEVERIGSLPASEREMLSSATEGMADDYSLSELREGPSSIAPRALRRPFLSPIPIPDRSLPKAMLQEHARRLGAAEARQEIIESAEITPAMFKQFDVDPNISEEEKQQRYRERFGDTQVSPSTLGTRNLRE